MWAVARGRLQFCYKGNELSVYLINPKNIKLRISVFPTEEHSLFLFGKEWYFCREKDI